MNRYNKKQKLLYKYQCTRQQAAHTISWLLNKSHTKKPYSYPLKISGEKRQENGPLA